MKAIETSYKGYRFRSRLEARWAVFFDALGIKWEYEKEGYELRDGEDVYHYLPDFWLPGIGWFEVKGRPASQDEITQCELLSLAAKEPVFLVQGEIPVPSLEGLSQDGEFLGCYPSKDGLRWMGSGWTWFWDLEASKPTIGIICEDYEPDEVFGSGPTPDLRYTKRIDDAYKAARSARFEFGEVPR